MKTSVDHGTTRARSGTAKKALSTVIATTLAISVSCVSSTALAQGMAISPGYLTGVWQENAQCQGSEAMVFFANNTMSSAGSTPVNYAVTGQSQFTMYGPGGSVPIEARAVNQNQMVVTFQGSAMVVHRCGAGGGNAVQLNNAFITGGWGMNGNCAAPEVFSAGGHFRTSNNDPGTWALFGNTLRMTLNNGNGLDFIVQVNGQRNMTLTQSNNGQVSNYTRCF